MKKVQFQIKLDISHLPSKQHKYASLNNHTQVFQDKRFKKPKHKQKIYQEY